MRPAKYVIDTMKSFGGAGIGILALVAFCLSLGTGAAFDGNVYLDVLLVVRALVFFILLSVLYALVLKGWGSVQSAPLTDEHTLSARKVLKTAGIILLCWLPYMLCLYPGVLSFDTSFQLSQFFGSNMPGIFPMPDDASYTDHHPLFVTLFFGCIVWVGNLVGSANLGCFLLCCFQAIMTALSFSLACHYLRYHGLSKRLFQILLIFFALFPVFPFAVMTPTKDTLFSWIFIGYFVLIIELVITKGKFLESKKGLITFCLVVLLLMLTKKTGIYILLVTSVILMVVYRKVWWRILVSAFAPALVCMLLVPMLVFPLLNVASGSKIEMLAPLFQQTARYVLDHPDDVTDEEREAIDAILGYDNLGDRYNFTIVDAVHHSWDDVNIWPTNQEIIAYVKTYLAQGLRHPFAYVEAAVSLEAGWFDINQKFIYPVGSGMLVEPTNGTPDIYRPTFFEYPAILVSGFSSWIQSIPGLNMFFVPALYAVVIPALATLLLLRKKKSLIWVAVPLAVSFLFLLLSPVSTVSTNMEALRYVLPFVYASPLFLGLAFCKNLNEPGDLKQ